MDPSNVSQPQPPIPEVELRKDHHTSALTGGMVMEEKFVDYENKPILDGLSAEQRRNVGQNADLRKKLRIDRMKKNHLATGAAVLGAQVDDPN
jgi:hypothetical protein